MKIVTTTSLAAELARLKVADPRVVASGNGAVPWTLLGAVDAAVSAFRLFMLNAPLGVPARLGVVHETPFVGPGMRGSAQLRYFPCRLSLVPRLLASTAQPDLVLLNASTPRRGMVSLGTEVNILPKAVEVARARGGLVIAQLNPAMPYTYGDGELSLDYIDLAVEVDEPLTDHRCAPPSDLQHALGAHLAALIGPEATLQVGIGAIPNATLDALRRRRGLSVFSEMISDGIRSLRESGALADDVAITTSFALGTRELYEWLHLNPGVVFRRTEVTNDPARIASHRAMTSINAALQVDLFDQANASYVRDAIYSGFGGQTDFIVGALHAPDGQALVALPSWHEASNSSTIIPMLSMPATSFQHSYVTTERGCAPMWGRSMCEQRDALIAIADPRAHAELAESAVRPCVAER